MRGFLRKPILPYPTNRPYASSPGGRRRRPVPPAIRRFHIPLPVMEATDRAMRRFGMEQRECYVWWGGYFTQDGDAQVVTALCPEVPSHFGRVQLANAELTKLQAHLRALDQVLIAELHTHPPGAGGQNEVDAAHPAATYPGFITVVVPDFAFPHFHDLRRTYVYEYLASGGWRELEAREVGERFVIEEPFFSVRVSP